MTHNELKTLTLIMRTNPESSVCSDIIKKNDPNELRYLSDMFFGPKKKEEDKYQIYFDEIHTTIYRYANANDKYLVSINHNNELRFFDLGFLPVKEYKYINEIIDDCVKFIEVYKEYKKKNEEA